MTRPLRIAHVVHSLELGGLENGVVNVINLMDAAEFHHTVICLTRAGSFAKRISNDNVAVIELGSPGTSFRFPLFKLCRMFRDLNLDIVHTRGWGAVDAVFAASVARVKAIIHGEHGREWTDTTGAHWKRNQIRRLIGHLVKRYVIVSEVFRPWLMKDCGVAAEKIVYIPNGVDTDKFCPCGEDGARQRAAGREERAGSRGQGAESFRRRDSIAETLWAKSSAQLTVGREQGKENGHRSAQAAVRRQLGLPPDGIWIGSVGRLDPVKDYPTLLKAFAALKTTIPDVRLAIAGDGPQRSELIGLAEKLGISSGVFWLGSRNDIPDVYRAFDVFVQCSLFEGMSNTILEAMATGLPIVASAAGGNPDLVIDGINGRLFPVDDVDALTEILCGYLPDTKRRHCHAHEGRHMAVQKFDVSVMAARYAELYQGLARGKL